MGTSWGVSKALITHESNSMHEGLEREKNQLKLLLGMTNTLVSNMEPRDLLRALQAKACGLDESHCRFGIMLAKKHGRSKPLL